MSAIYESRRLLDEYLLFHYGSEAEILPGDVSWPAGMREALGFARRTASHFEATPAARGLDLGCAVGRSAFEMARHCREVVGVDFSHAFIGAAKAMQAGGALTYSRLEEAGRGTPLVARCPDDVEPARLSFLQGDAMALPADLGAFDRVHAANLLCRLTDPERLLERLPELVARGGELVIATPCTWLEEFTPPARWPRGSTLDWLVGHLGGAFELVRETDEPFLIRETARKFQWTRSQLSVWRRHP